MHKFSTPVSIPPGIDGPMKDALRICKRHELNKAKQITSSALPTQLGFVQ